MNDLVPGSRRYSEKEVGLLLRRATQMQRAELTAGDPEGLTLAELQEIAQEAGIDPGMLRQAADEIDSRGVATFGSRLAGAPMKISLERVIPGEFPPEDLDELISIIQAAMAGQGTASAVGGTLSWASRSEGKMSSQQVLITSKDGKTLIRIEEGVGELSAGLFGGIMGGVGGGVGLGIGGAIAGMLGSVALAVAFPVAALGGSYVLARQIFVRQVEKKRRAAATLMAHLVERIERGIGSRTLPASEEGGE
jgi:hypothetical protein